MLLQKSSTLYYCSKELISLSCYCCITNMLYVAVNSDFYFFSYYSILDDIIVDLCGHKQEQSKKD